MRFLVTGSIRSDHGPRRILTGALIFFLLFTGAHFAREWSSVGYTPQRIQENLGGEFSTQAILLLEDLHIDLVLFGMALLFIGSVLYQVRGSRNFRNGIFTTLSGLILAYVAVRFLVPLGAIFSYLVAALYFLVHALLAGVLIWILTDLYRGKA
ncbi:MAG TPA: hypothetical protein DEA96_00275 [Leptospiraceae bacterium]|nr:hypothetical protein [Spirochaetaceae bacterium]HBS03367.1 hypothetical protein [Leptospiraceae bacterium]|tara:strand:- start:7457 stop:7918 length:462 start_codon:yes stop_codon:yes gene_type:complete